MQPLHTPQSAAPMRLKWMVCKYQHLPDPGRSAEWICYDETGRVWFFRKTQKLLGFKLELPKVMSHTRVLLVFIFLTLCSHQMSSSCIGCVPRNKNLHLEQQGVWHYTPRPTPTWSLRDFACCPAMPPHCRLNVDFRQTSPGSFSWALWLGL